MSFNEIYQSCLDLSREERIIYCRDSFETLLKELEPQIGKQEAFNLIVSAICTISCIDRKVSQEEYRLLLDTLYSNEENFSYDQFYAFCSEADGDEDKLDEIIDSMGELKNEMLFLVLHFLCCDGTLSVSEQEFFKKLLD